jgi:hypothetical protein
MDRKVLSRNEAQKVIKLAVITVMKIYHISVSCWFLQHETATHTCFHQIFAGPTQNLALTIRTTSTATLPTLQSVPSLNQHVTAAINSLKE